IVAVPALLAVAMLFAPVRERAESLFRPHGDTDSNQFRVVVWGAGMRMIRAHPWLGLGPEQPGRQMMKYIDPMPNPLPSGYYGHLHNVYLQYAAERGVPTLLAMLWFIGQTLFDAGRGLRRRDLQPDERFLLHGAIAAIIALLIVGFAEYNLGD